MSSITRRMFVQAGAAGAAAQAQDARRPAADVPRPNVLFIMLDQWRFDCLGANGNELIRTPNMDRLSARSANFTQTCVQSRRL